jgi:hypothetical protein
MRFQDIKRTKVPKKKLMLWVDQDIVDKIEELKPPSITVQEAIRQVLNHYVNEDDYLEGL